MTILIKDQSRADERRVHSIRGHLRDKKREGVEKGGEKADKMSISPIPFTQNSNV